MIRFILTFLCILFLVLGNSQNVEMAESLGFECAQNFQRARIQFEKGLFNDVIYLIGDCSFNKSVKKVERIKMLELLVESYLEIKKWQKADSAYLQILQLRPTHSPTENNKGIELTYFSNNFYSHPSLSFSFYSGINWCKPSVSQVFSAGDVIIREEKYEAKPVGSQFGVTADFSPFKTNFSIGLDINWHKVKYTYTGIYDNTPYSDGETYRAALSYREIGTWTSIGIFGKYYLRNKESARFAKAKDGSLKKTRWHQKFEPYIYLGGSYDRLQDAELEAISLLYPSIARVRLGSNYNLQEPKLRTDSNFSLFGGIGAHYKVRSAFVSLDLRYLSTLKNYVDTENRYANLILRQDFNFVDNDFRMNEIFINLGIGFSFFKSRKLAN